MDSQGHQFVLTRSSNFTIIRAYIDIIEHECWIKIDRWNVAVQSMVTKGFIL